jgi:Uma2 family endonuclease
MAHAATFEEYLALEELAPSRHEYLDGRVRAIAGGSPAHARIAANVAASLVRGLAGRSCGVFSADLRIRAPATSLGTYADVTVVCGPLELEPEDRRGHTVLNPRVVVEILSPSTEGYDRGEKLEHYKTIRSLQEIVLVAHDRSEVEIVRREPDGSWSRHVTGEHGFAGLSSLGLELSVEEIYRDPLAG